MKSIQQLAKEVAAGQHLEVDLEDHFRQGDAYDSGFAAGIEFMYKAMGWRDAKSDPPEDGANPLYLFDGGSRFSGYYLDRKFYSFITQAEVKVSHWRPLPDPPNSTDQLQKAFEEQLKHKP